MCNTVLESLFFPTVSFPSQIYFSPACRSVSPRGQTLGIETFWSRARREDALHNSNRHINMILSVCSSLSLTALKWTIFTRNPKWTNKETLLWLRKTVDVWILIRMWHFSELSFKSLRSHFINCWKKNCFTQPMGLSQHRTHRSVLAPNRHSAPNPQDCLSTSIMSTALQQVHSCDNSFFNNVDITYCISVNKNWPNWPRGNQFSDLCWGALKMPMTTDNHSDVYVRTERFFS